MTNTQKTKENEIIDQGPGSCCDDSCCDDSCCDDSCCGGSIGRVENEERRCC
jgi:hypothetical protein